MRFSGERGPEEVEAHLGDLACALEARLERGRSGDERVTLRLSAEALGASERELLERAGGTRLATGPALARLTIEPGQLAELANASAGARCLLATLRAGLLRPGPARIMGILNVTPDSFSDGGTHFGTERAILHGQVLMAEGADIVDVGGESTRPGSEPVPSEIECERVIPVTEALVRDGRAALSVDTRKANVARAALAAGAVIVNDISAGQNDSELLQVVAEHEAGLVLMHMQGLPRDMQRAPSYADVVREVAAHLRERARAAWRAGVDPARIALDPGFGFGKLLEHNLALMRALPELRSLGFPLCLGLSRKGFLGRLSGQEAPSERGPETTAATALGAYLGAEIHRVHEVGPARAALRVACALSGGEARPAESLRPADKEA